MAAPDPKSPITLIVGTIGLASAIVGIATAPAFVGQAGLLYTLGAGSLVATSYAGVLALKRPPLLKVACQISDAQLNILFALGHRVYSESLRKPYPERTLLEAWRSKYQDGIFHAIDSSGTSWGYLSVWPLKQNELLRISSYEIGEEELIGEMVEVKANSPFSYWYVADLCKDTRKFHPSVSNELFSKYIAITLIRSALQILIKQKQFQFPLQFVGIAVTAGGRRWLKKFDFQRTSKPKTITQRQDDVYTRSFSNASMKRLIRQLKSEERTLAKDIRNAMQRS